MRGEYRFLVINNRMIDTIFIYSVLCAVTAYFNSIILKELFSKSVDTDVLYWQFTAGAGFQFLPRTDTPLL